MFDDGAPAAVDRRSAAAAHRPERDHGRVDDHGGQAAARPGFYRARVVLRDGGDYAYAVLVRQDARRAAGASRGDPGLVVLAHAAGHAPDRAPAPLPAAGARRSRSPPRSPPTSPTTASRSPARSSRSTASAPTSAGRRSLYAAGATAAALLLLLLGDSDLGVLGAGGDLRGVRAPPGCWATTVRTPARAARRVEAEQQANVQRTAAEEQARIARELHDIIGHSVSVMTIQAAAAGDAFDSRPAQVREALRAIESTGRETLAELRRLLAGEQTACVRPRPRPRRASTRSPSACGPPGLAVELSRRAGVAAAERRPVGVPDRAGGAHQHAQARRARRPRASTCARRGGALEIDVVDDGQGAAAVTPGHGIIGMRERAALFGGDLTAGPGARRRVRGAREDPRRGADDPRPARRRPGARAQRLPADPRDARGPRGRRRGRGRARGGRPRPPAATRT